MNSVEDLDVFKLAHELALRTYSAAKTFPREEMYSLVDQMRRAAISVGMNLMEGAMRLGTKEYRQFVGIARGSAGEVCYQLLVARDLNYISPETYHELRSDYDRVIQMLSRLSQSLGSEPRTRTDGGDVVAFMVQLEVEVEEGIWRPVLRYDCAHDFAHRDRYNLKGEQDKQEIPLTYPESLDLADKDINENWDIYRERFLRGDFP